MARVAVVGAGLGGLTAAARLAHSGHRVDVFEQQDFAGGKAGSRTIGGYRFDTGPSLFTLPEVFRRVFQDTGERLEDYVSLVPLEPICRYFYPDGTRLASSSDPKRFGAEIEKKTLDSSAALEAYLRHAGRVYDAAAELFLWNSLHVPSSYFSKTGLRAIRRVGRIDVLRSLDRANRAFFVNPRTVQLFDRYATYNGSNPYRLPATFSIIPYIEYTFGGYAVRGGIYAVPQAIYALGRNKGVRFHFGRRVERILTAGRAVSAVVVEGAEIPCDVVVSNADVLQTYRTLLEDREAPWARRYDRLEPSSSGLVYYWGMGRSFEELGVHNVFFSSNYEREFEAIFDRRVCPEDPTIYINITSKVSPEDAPAGGENWFILLNAPHNSGQNWPQAARHARRRIVERLENLLAKPVEKHIEVEETMTPVDIEADTGSTYGSLYGICSNSPLAAFHRHPNRSRRYRGLYFCGGSAHPGGGMPLAVLSGRIASQLVEKYEAE